MSDQPTRAGLLAQAARCYRNAGLPADALRCLEQAGDWQGAALLHRAAGRFARAADCFERAERFADAADCHLQARRPEAAARCLELAGDPLGAAWLLAHLARRPVQAEAMLARVPAPLSAGAAAGSRDPAAVDPTAAARQPIALDLVRARIAAHRDQDAAARLLRRAAVGLAALPTAPGDPRLLAWAQCLAQQVLERADLAAELHAAAHRAGLPDSGPGWEAWAQAELGDSTGVPEPSAALAQDDDLMPEAEAEAGPRLGAGPGPGPGPETAQHPTQA